MDQPQDISENNVIVDPIAQRKLTLALGYIIFFSVLNGTMFNVSLPDIAKQFELLPSRVSWVMSGYIILFALGSMTYGRLADTHPVKDLITVGLALFCTGSLLGFVAQWYPLLVIGRMVQAAGSGAIPALAMLVTTRYLSADIRGRSLGFIASVGAFGGAVGPILGGFITASLHWRFLFLFSLLSLAAVPTLRRCLPAGEGRRSSFDLTGAVLMAVAVGSLLLFITIPDRLLLAGGVAAAAWFAVHVIRTEHPFVHPGLFRDVRYRTMLVVSFLTIGTVFGMMFITPLMLRDVNGLSAGGIGMTMFPGAMSAALLGIIGGRLSDRLGSVRIVLIGQALLVAGFSLLALAAGLAPLYVALPLVLCNAGFTFLQASLAHTVADVLPRERMGVGMGMYNLSTFLSGAVSTAVLGKVLDHSRDHAVPDPLAAAGPYRTLFLALALVGLTAGALFAAAFRRRG
jgi:DHA2 family metal-tetracycline-proton antiporter-like MFS transporter